MDKTLVAQTVANRLFATENAVDNALIEAAQMMQTLIQARQDLRLSAVVGDKAPAQLAQAMVALTAARSALVETHSELADLKLRVGIRTKLIGVFDKVAVHEGRTTAQDRIAG